MAMCVTQRNHINKDTIEINTSINIIYNIFLSINLKHLNVISSMSIGIIELSKWIE